MQTTRTYSACFGAVGAEANVARVHVPAGWSGAAVPGIPEVVDVAVPRAGQLLGRAPVFEEDRDEHAQP